MDWMEQDQIYNVSSNLFFFLREGLDFESQEVTLEGLGFRELYKKPQTPEVTWPGVPSAAVNAGLHTPLEGG